MRRKSGGVSIARSAPFEKHGVVEKLAQLGVDEKEVHVRNELSRGNSRRRFVHNV